MNTEVLLQLENICYTYEDGPFSLQNISLTLRRGEQVAVLGGNGAGKSTFFLLLAGVLRPDSGALYYRDKPVDTAGKRELTALRQQVGIVFQDPNQQIIGPTVEAEVSFGPMNLRLPREAVEARVDAAVEAMGLGGLRDCLPHYLSGGEKKRVTIADVLAMEPQIILLDEPTASLDPGGTAELEAVMAALSRQEKTLVVSTHDIDFAWRWADRLLVFHRGRLLTDAHPGEVFANGELLRQTGLRRPYLYEFALLMQRRGLLPTGVWPRTLAELDTQLGTR